MSNKEYDRTSLKYRRRKARQRRQRIKSMALLSFIIVGILFTGRFFLGAERYEGDRIPDVSIVSFDELGNQKTKVERQAPQDPVSDSWKLTLVNAWSPLPEDYSITITPLKNEQSIDQRCYPDLQRMLDDCEAEGLLPLICSSYRSWEKQESLYNKHVRSFMGQGYSLEDAKKEAGKIVAAPGTSEHQLGLAVDIVDMNNQNLDETQEHTPVQKWLMENSWKYGFILRYPNDKKEVTGIMYEPWHYRYVGKEAAEEIYRQGICLEEYLEQMEKGV